MPMKPRSYRPMPSAGKPTRKPDYRGTPSQRGYDATWAKFSKWYRREHPLCVICERKGYTTPAEHVDHIVPLEHGGEKYDEDNLQSLCVACHNAKTARERGQ